MYNTNKSFGCALARGGSRSPWSMFNDCVCVSLRSPCHKPREQSEDWGQNEHSGILGLVQRGQPSGLRQVCQYAIRKLKNSITLCYDVQKMVWSPDGNKVLFFVFFNLKCEVPGVKGLLELCVLGPSCKMGTCRCLRVNFVHFAFPSIPSKESDATALVKAEVFTEIIQQGQGGP